MQLVAQYLPSLILHSLSDWTLVMEVSNIDLFRVLLGGNICSRFSLYLFKVLALCRTLESYIGVRQSAVTPNKSFGFSPMFFYSSSDFKELIPQFFLNVEQITVLTF